MVKYQRLTEYIHDYFPDPTYNTQDIRDWAKENVPAWDKIPTKDKEDVLGDWEDFIQPKVERRLSGFSRRFIGKIRKFLGRLF